MEITFSKKFVTEFIELYKSQECLWKKSHKNYRNRIARDNSHSVLISFVRKYYKFGDRIFVIKRIQSLRSTFRKEYNKYLESKAKYPNGKYKPSLWYFDLLLFTTNQCDQIDNRNIKKDLDKEMDTVNGNSNKNRDDNKQEFNTIEISEASDTSQSSSDSEVESRKRKIEQIITQKNKMVKLPQPTERRTQFEVNVSEYDSVGINVAAKLKRMDPEQATYAEFLINKVLTMGLLRKLTRGTDVSHNPSVFNNFDNLDCRREVNLSD